MLRRLFGILVRSRAYLNLAYVLIHLPLAVVYGAIIGFIMARGFETIPSLLLLIPAGVAVWSVVLGERALARGWFGARLTPLGPPRGPDRRLRDRVVDLVTNPVTWKSLAYVAIEVVAGSTFGLLALAGTAIGFAGTAGCVMAFAVTGIVGILVSPHSLPPYVPVIIAASGVVCFAILLATLHIAGPVARAQVWFVRVMLGMSETQAALAAARAEADAQRTRADVSDRSRRDLVLNVSHELRNPLATIRAHVDTLHGDGGVEPPEEDRRRYLDVLGRETERLSSLVEELLTLASADSGGLHLDMQPVDAAAVASQVHEAMAPLAWRERHIQLLCSTDGTREPVLADRGRLTQVLMNLVRNAITQTPEGGLVAIEVKPVESGPVEVIVSDTGPGIASEDREKIFERFYRTDESRARSTGGFGLGLAIAREMVEAMGGRIRVDSTHGQGSRFTVTLGRAG
ncbi:MAG TPA: ATP-binding protein [Candidatus Dormibacteraeota bacterium]|nr:ATP-binding protein [Candidatus Dormibacteraeota bacterium]